MTTIAWDGKTLATDSLSTHDGTVISHTTQKLFVSDNPSYSAMAVCGAYSECLGVMDWLNSSKCGDMPKLPDGSAVLCVENGELFCYSGECAIPDKMDAPYADGSGWLLAIAAMDLGLNSVAAVKYAMKRDCFTGGDVQSYTVEESKNED